MASNEAVIRCEPSTTDCGERHAVKRLSAELTLKRACRNPTKTTLLVGAGVSVDPPSNIPLAGAIMDLLCERLARGAPPDVRARLTSCDSQRSFENRTSGRTRLFDSNSCSNGLPMSSRGFSTSWLIAFSGENRIDGIGG